jgi:hypothetical protein
LKREVFSGINLKQQSKNQEKNPTLKKKKQIFTKNPKHQNN